MSSDENSTTAEQQQLIETSENVQSQSDRETQPPAQQAQQHSLWSIVKGIILRAVIIYFITSFFRRPSTTSHTTMPERTSVNLFSNGTVMDFYVYVSEKQRPAFDAESLVWFQPNLVYGDWYGGPNGDGTYTLETELTATKSIQTNSSIWIHTCVSRHGLSPNPHHKHYSRTGSICRTKRLNKYKKLRYYSTHNLLTGETSASPEAIKKAEVTPIEVVSHWHPNLTINIIFDYTMWVQGSVPPPLDEYVKFDDISGDYYPILYFNDYWNLARDYMPINETVKSLPLKLQYQPLSLFRWQLYTAQSMRSQLVTSFIGHDEDTEEEMDPLKEALMDTSPFLLALTFIVSLLHSIFEFLAFKNDIQFWNNRKSLEGLSVRSVFFNVFQSVVVLLYVLDNDTNFVVRISCFVGLIIELWKINKVTDVCLDRENRIFFNLLPSIKLLDKGSYVESSTKQYDVLAFRYLSWALFPMLACYAVYSLLYLEHKGWYSWVLSMLYGFLLTFGFIMMTPQLFINYKLKSVAHLPWRMLTYKFLNTFTDDIFAFVIRMPVMYRLGCFRDDIVFCIYLYQRWIYRVDPKRMNEFGTSGEMEVNGCIPNADSTPSDPIESETPQSSDKKND